MSQEHGTPDNSYVNPPHLNMAENVRSHMATNPALSSQFSAGDRKLSDLQHQQSIWSTEPNVTQQPPIHGNLPFYDQISSQSHGHNFPLSYEQEQHLLASLHQQLLLQQQQNLPQSNPSNNVAFEGLGGLPNGISCPKEPNFTFNDISYAMTNNPAAYQPLGEPYVSDVYTSSTLTAPSSGSLNRSSSDLGLRINNFPLNLGGITGTPRAAPLVNPIETTEPSLLPSVFSDQDVSSQITNTALLADDNCIVRNLIKNTSNPSLLNSISSPHDSKHLETAELLTPSKEVTGFPFEDLQRAPGTPLTQTPPPRRPCAKDSENRFFNNNGTNSNTSEYSKKNNQNNGGNIKNRKKQKPKNYNERKNQVDSQIKLDQNVEQQLSESSNGNFSFYSCHKVPNLFNLITSNEKVATNERFSPSPESREAINISANNSKPFNNKPAIARTKSDCNSVVSSIAEAVEGSCKLSYSDVLSSCKISAERPSQDMSAMMKDCPFISQKSKQTSNINCNSSHPGQLKYGKKFISSGTQPSSPSRNSGGGKKPCLPFGSKVGLDEFNYPTREELAALYRKRNSSFSSEGSNLKTVNTSDGQDKNLHEHLFAKDGNETNAHSLPITPQHSRKKSTAVLNNNQATSNPKLVLKKATFINNDLSEDRTENSQLSDSPAEGNSSGNEDLSEFEVSEYDDEDEQVVEDVMNPVKANNSRSSGNSGTPSARLRGSGTTVGPTPKSSVKAKAKKKRECCSLPNNRKEWQDLVRLVIQILVVYLVLATRWLYHLVSEVLEMSSTLFMDCWGKAYKSGSVYASQFYRIGLLHWNKFYNKYIKSFASSKSSSMPHSCRSFLSEPIALPNTGEDAMKRLQACKELDSYSILGVTPTATQEEIRKYYRRQAFLVHPDKNKTGGAEEAFKILAHAFEDIGEPAKREEYDRRIKGEEHIENAYNKLDELLKEMERKLDEALNSIRCTSCNKRHPRVKIPDRPVYAARYCAQCNIRHAAKDGDIWAESKYRGLWWRYFACMDGAVYEISEWAACQAPNLKQLKANTHTVQYRIVAGKKKQRDNRKDHHDFPSEPEIEEFFNQLYRAKFPQGFSNSSSPPCPPQPSEGSAPSRRKGERGKGRCRR